VVAVAGPGINAPARATSYSINNSVISTIAEEQVLFTIANFLLASIENYLVNLQLIITYNMEHLLQYSPIKPYTMSLEGGFLIDIEESLPTIIQTLFAIDHPLASEITSSQSLLV